MLNIVATYQWIDGNPAQRFGRRTYIGRDAALLNPPTDPQVPHLIDEVGAWSTDMVDLIRLR